MDGTRRRVAIVRGSALIGAVGVTYSVAAAFTVGALQPDHDPAGDTVSELALGPFGMVMTTTFWLHGATIVVLGIGLLYGLADGLVSRAGSALLIASGAGISMLAFFPTDAAHEATTWRGITHFVIAGASLTGLAVAGIVYAHAFRLDPHYANYHRAAVILAGTVAAAFVAFAIYAFLSVGDIVDPLDAYMGAAERVLIGCNLAWLMAASWWLARTSSDPDHVIECHRGSAAH